MSCRLLLLFIVSIIIFLLCLYCIVFFFFSSRRRHTRCSRDWSSDVCSSDLWAEAGIVGGECDSHLSWRGSFGQSPVPPLTPDGSDCHVVATQHGAFAGHDQIGRASCRERV